MPIYDKKHYPLYMTKIKPYKQVQYNCDIQIQYFKLFGIGEILILLGDIF